MLWLYVPTHRVEAASQTPSIHRPRAPCMTCAPASHCDWHIRGSLLSQPSPGPIPGKPHLCPSPVTARHKQCSHAHKRWQIASCKLQLACSPLKTQLSPATSRVAFCQLYSFWLNR